MKAGCDGAFLINHSIHYSQLLEIARTTAAPIPTFWLGLNLLDREAYEAFRVTGPESRGLWTDNALIDEDSDSQANAEYVATVRATTAWQGIYFGSVAFKYQPLVRNPARTAVLATGYVDVVTTSGDRTCNAPPVDKIASMKDAISNHPLAIASGITIENIPEFLPHADRFLVATGIRSSFDWLDPEKTRKLAEIIHSWS
jgi:hypothetical protein